MSHADFSVNINPIAHTDIDFVGKDVVIFSHRDCFDGTVAAYIASVAVNWGQCASCEIIYGNYDKEKPVLPKIYDSKPIVLIVDYSFKDIQDLIALSQVAETIVWLDHHETAYKTLTTSGVETFPNNLHIELTSSYSGALLVSRFFKCGGPFNFIATHVDDHDRHQHKLGENTKIITDLLAMYGLDDLSSVEKIVNEFAIPYLSTQTDTYRERIVQDMNNKLQAYKAFLESSIKGYVKNAFTVTIKGESFISAIAPRSLRGPLNAALMVEYGVDVAGILSFEENQIRLSLRSNANGEAMRIAEHCDNGGGGGHANAAGAVVDVKDISIDYKSTIKNKYASGTNVAELTQTTCC